jgi:ABC-type transport system involved in cytochrome c biogenesis permease subunit
MFKKFSCLMAAGLVLCTAAAIAEAPAAPAWPEEVLALAATLPVQDGGRVKPLDTYAQFLMLRINGKRSFTTPEPEKHRVGPVEWMLTSMFYPSVARHWPHFLVENDEALVAAGITTHEKKRDRYSYDELAAHREKLFTLAQQYQAVDPKQRDLVQQQVLNLANNMFEYEHLIGMLEFARMTVRAEGGTEVAKEIPEPEGISILTAFERVPKLLLNIRGNPMGLTDEQVQEEARVLSGILDQMEQAATQAQGVAIFPPQDATVKEWQSPGEMMSMVMQMPGMAGPAAMPKLRQLEALAINRDQASKSGDTPELKNEFVAQFSTLHKETRALAEARGEYGRIPLEVHFYKGKYLFYSQWLYVLSFVLIAISWLMGEAKLYRKMLPLSVMLPTLLLIVGITLRCIIRGRPPVSTLYETILFITAVAVLTALFAEYANRQGIALAMGSFLGCLGMFLAHRYELKEGVDTMPSLVAVLDTNFWLSTHVTTVTMGYAAGLLAGGLAHVYILGRLFGFNKNDPGFYRGVTRMVYGVLCFCLIFATVGTILGGIWANDSWGRFWGWDPKENGALMICLWGLVLLHLRMGRYIKDIGLHAGNIVLAMIVAFSWWGVNLLGVGLHSYGFTSGIMNLLAVYWGLECLVILCCPVLFFRDMAQAPPAPPVEKAAKKAGKHKVQPA